MAGAARDIETAVQFMSPAKALGYGGGWGEAKKKRREQGKMLRGAQFSEHRGSYSPFKPYTV